MSPNKRKQNHVGFVRWKSRVHSLRERGHRIPTGRTPISIDATPIATNTLKLGLKPTRYRYLIDPFGFRHHETSARECEAEWG